MSINDNDPGAPAPLPSTADAHGQAALILVESLIHGLIGKLVLTTQESLEIVTTALEVQADYVDAHEGALEMHRSHILLARVAASLGADADVPADPVIRGAGPVLVDVDAPSSGLRRDGTDVPPPMEGDR